MAEINAGELSIGLSVKDNASPVIDGIKGKIAETGREIDRMNEKKFSFRDQVTPMLKGILSELISTSDAVDKSGKKKISINTSEAESKLDSLYTTLDLLNRRIENLMLAKVDFKGFDGRGLESIYEKFDALTTKALDPSNYSDGGKFSSSVFKSIANDIKILTPDIKALEKELSDANSEAAKEAVKLAQQINSVAGAMQKLGALERTVKYAQSHTVYGDYAYQALDQKLADIKAVREELLRRLNEFGGKSGAFANSEGVSMFTILNGAGGFYSEVNRFAKQVIENSKLSETAEKKFQKWSSDYGKAITDLKSKLESLNRDKISIGSKIELGKQKGIDTSMYEASYNRVTKIIGDINHLINNVPREVVIGLKTNGFPSLTRDIAELKTSISSADKALGLMKGSMDSTDKKAVAGIKYNRYESMVESVKSLIAYVDQLNSASKDGFRYDTSQLLSARKILNDINAELTTAANTGVMPKNLNLRFSEAMSSGQKAIDDMNKSMRDKASIDAKAITDAENLAVAQGRVRNIIVDIEKQMQRVEAAMSKNGVSDTTISSLESWKSSLGSIKGMYESIMYDDKKIKDKTLLSSLGSERYSVSAMSSADISKANKEASQYKSAQDSITASINKASNAMRDFDKVSSSASSKGFDVENIQKYSSILSILIHQFGSMKGISVEPGELSRAMQLLNDIISGGKSAKAALEDMMRGTATEAKAVDAAERSRKKSVDESNTAYRQLISSIQRAVDLEDRLSLKSKQTSASGVDTSDLDGKIAKLRDARLIMEGIQNLNLDKKVVVMYTDELDRVSKDAIKAADGIDKLVKANENISAANEKYKQLLSLLSEVRSVNSLIRDVNSGDGAKIGTKKISGSVAELERLKKELESAISNGSVSKDLESRISNAFKNANKAISDSNKAMSDKAKKDAKAIADAENLSVAQDRVRKILVQVAAESEKVHTAMNQKGVSDTTISSLESWKTKLAEIEATYRTILSDSEMIKSKPILSDASLEKYKAVSGAKSDIARANAEAASFAKSQKDGFKEAKASVEEYDASRRRLLKKIEASKAKEEDLAAKSFKYSAAGVDTTHLDKYIQKLAELRQSMELISNLKVAKKESLMYTGEYERLSGEADRLAKTLKRSADAAKPSADGAQKIDEANRKAAQAAQQNKEAAKKLVSEYERLSKAADRSSGSLNKLKDLFMQFAPVYGLQQMVMSIIQIGGEIEKQHIALQSILGDLHNANEMFSQIKNLALQSPFKFGELNKDVKQLAAYGVEYENLYDTTKRLADISAGLGVSFERIALAYGQVKSRSWLDAKELRQFAYAGVPLLQNLADMYSQTQGKAVNASQVKKMISNRQVSFEDVQSVLWKMTDEGGKFFNMQSVLAETLYGRYNKLIDAWEIMLSGFARGENVIGGTFKVILDLITKIVLSINSIAPAIMAAFAPRVLKNLFSGLAIFKGGVVSNILAAKSKEAQSIRAKIASDPSYKTTKYEQQVLATEKQITAAEARRLAIAGQINKKELQLLYIKGHINREEYLYLTNQTKSLANTKLLVGASSALKATWSGITSLLGGVPMMIASAALAAGTYFITSLNDVKDAVKQIQDELLDRFKKMHDFLSTNNIWSAMDGGNAINMLKMIKRYEEEIESLNPERAGVIISKGMDTTDYRSRLMYLKEQIELMKEANGYADANTETFYSKTSKDFENAKEAANAYSKALANLDNKLSRFRDSDYKNLFDRLRMSGDTEDAFRFENMFKTSSRDSMNKAIREWVFNSAKQRSQGDPLSGELSRAIRDVEKYTERLSVAISETFANVGKDPRVTEGVRQMRESIETKLEFTPFARDLININLDRNLKIGGEEEARDKLTNEIKKLIENSPDDSIRRIGYKLKYKLYDELEPSERDALQRLISDARKNVIRDSPYMLKDVQGIFNNNELYMHIGFKFGKPDLNDLQKAIMPRAEGELLSVRQFVENWTSVGTLTDARSQAKKAVEEAKGELERLEDQAKENPLLKGNFVHVNLVENAQKKYDAAVAAQKYVGIDPEKSKGRSNKDKELEYWRNLLQLMKAYRQEYEKYKKVYGEDAMDNFKETEIYKKLNTKELRDLGLNLIDPDAELENWKNFNKVMQEDLAKTTTKANKEAREKTINEGIKQEVDVKVTLDTREAEAKLKILADEFTRTQKRWQEFNNLSGKYGKELSLKTALNSNDRGYASQMDFLVKSLQRNIDKLKKVDKPTVEDIVGGKYNDEQLEKLFGSDKVSMVYKLRDAIKDLSDSLISDGRNTILAQFDKIKGTDADIIRINNEYEDIVRKSKDFYDATVKAVTKRAEDEIESINNSLDAPEVKEQNTNAVNSKRDEDISNASAVMQRAIGIASAERDYKVLEKSIEYTKLLNDSINLTSNQAHAFADTIRNGLNSALSSGVISAEEYTSKIKQINEIVGKLDKVGYLGSDVNSNFNAYAKGGIDGVISNVVDAYTKQIADARDSGDLDLADDLERTMNDTVSNLQKFSNNLSTALDVIGLVTSVFDGLANATKGLSDMFYALGDEDNGNFFSDLTDGIKGVSSIFKPVNNIVSSALKGDVSGIVSSAISAPVDLFTAPVTAFATLHDKQIDREIEASKRRQAEAEAFLKNVKSAFSSQMDTYNKGAKVYEVSKIGTRKESTFMGLSSRSSDIYGVTSRVVDDQYKYEKEALEKQRDEALRQLNEESKKKHSDDSAMESYKQQISELQQSIDELATEMAKSIYGIDVSGWASQLSSSLVDAWASGSKAAKAYKDTVKDVMKSVVSNLITKKVMEAALEPASKYVEDAMSDDGKIDEDELVETYRLLKEGMTQGIDGAYSILDYLKSKGLDVSDTGSGNGTLTNSIKNITEETADLLASYLNSIRLYVAEDNLMMKNLMETYFSQMPTIARSQLSQLESISKNTFESAAGVSTIISILNAITSTSGVKRVNIN